MKVGRLLLDGRLVTRLTKRSGSVVFQCSGSRIVPPSTCVRFDDGTVKYLHPDVEVDLEEVAG